MGGRGEQRRQPMAHRHTRQRASQPSTLGRRRSRDRLRPMKQLAPWPPYHLPLICCFSPFLADQLEPLRTHL